MAIRLDKAGSDVLDFGDVAAMDAPAAFTWMAWFRREAANLSNDDLTNFRKGGSAFLYAPSSVTPNGIGCGISGVAERRISTANQWPSATYFHLACTYTSTGPVSQFYVNGVAATMAGSEPTWADQGANALQMNRNTGADVDIALFKLFSAVLTAAEIKQEMLLRRLNRKANLVIWCPFDDGTTPKDYSGNGFHPTNTGGTYVDGPPVTFGARAA